MSEAVDKESQTEEASEKKTRDAVERGEKPVSRDMTAAMTLLRLLFALTFILGPGANRLTHALGQTLAASGQFRLGQAADVWIFGGALAKYVFVVLAPLLFTILAAAVASHVLPGDLRLSTSRLKMRTSRINPLAGLKRMMSQKGFAEFGKSVAKLLVCGLVSALLLKSYATTLLDGLYLEPSLLAPTALNIVLRLLASVAAVMGVIALLDFLHVRYAWRVSLRMTKQEVKDEFKQADGDPYVKARLRSIAMDRARRRMIVDVERATVVIANPTHFAIALRYAHEEGGAPLVLAKGVDLIALKIRDRAEVLGIPVIENPPLARAMYDHLEIGRMIPQAFYRAVAEIINHLSTQSRR